MIEILSEADIRCPAEKIFDVIIDFRGQDRWLAESSAFPGRRWRYGEMAESAAGEDALGLVAGRPAQDRREDLLARLE